MNKNSQSGVHLAQGFQNIANMVSIINYNILFNKLWAFIIP